MKKIETVWVDGFSYTKRQYKKAFPDGPGNRVLIPRTIYKKTILEKASDFMQVAKIAILKAAVILPCIIGIVYCISQIAAGM